MFYGCVLNSTPVRSMCPQKRHTVPVAATYWSCLPSSIKLTELSLIHEGWEQFKGGSVVGTPPCSTLRNVHASHICHLVRICHNHGAQQGESTPSLPSHLSTPFLFSFILVFLFSTRSPTFPLPSSQLLSSSPPQRPFSMATTSLPAIPPPVYSPYQGLDSYPPSVVPSDAAVIPPGQADYPPSLNFPRVRSMLRWPSSTLIICVIDYLTFALRILLCALVALPFAGIIAFAVHYAKGGDLRCKFTARLMCYRTSDAWTFLLTHSTPCGHSCRHPHFFRGHHCLGTLVGAHHLLANGHRLGLAWPSPRSIPISQAAHLPPRLCYRPVHSFDRHCAVGTVSAGLAVPRVSGICFRVVCCDRC